MICSLTWNTGGLVELAPTRLISDGDQVPTRTIGDPSTGTDPGPNTSSTPSMSSERPSAHQHRSDQGSEYNDNTSYSQTPTGRPSYVELPKRPIFMINNSNGTVQSSDQSPDAMSTLSSVSRTDRYDPPLRVLVVDDDTLTRRLMKRMLTRLGCAVSTAENGAIALELIMGEGITPASEETNAPNTTTPSSETNEPPENRPRYDGPRYEVIFLDNQMPVLSGIDAVAKLRQAGRSDFVVGVTGSFNSPFKYFRVLTSSQATPYYPIKKNT